MSGSTGSTSEGGDELLDPVRGQYNEFFLLIGCSYQGQPTYICPFMYVDNDANLYRGLIQGLPKQQAVIRMSRSYPIANASGSPLLISGLDVHYDLGAGHPLLNNPIAGEMALKNE